MYKLYPVVSIFNITKRMFFILGVFDNFFTNQLEKNKINW